MARKVNLIDLTMRDAHQCLWATRMTTAMIKDIAPLLDRCGFEALDLVGGMISNLRYQLGTLGLEDRLQEILEEAGHVVPISGIRSLSARSPNTSSLSRY